MRKLDIGIASYGNPEGLSKLLRSLEQHCRTDWRAVVISNPHPDREQDEAALGILQGAGARVEILRQEKNIGYVGAVNEILARAMTEYVAYCDHDVEHFTEGWDDLMAGTLDRFHEVGMLFGNGGPYPIDRGNYWEILWGVGCCWMLPRRVITKVGPFDGEIGHHEEVDYALRVRLAGYRIAALPEVRLAHAAKASTDPAAQDRISKGVIAWVDKWEKFFGGERQGYHSPKVLRHELWPPSALYLEEYFRRHLPDLNASPETVTIMGQEFDLIRVPRLKGFYRHRII